MGEDVSGEAAEMLAAVHGAFFVSWGERCAQLKHFKEKQGVGGRKEVERPPALILSSCELILKTRCSLRGCWS